MNDTVWRHYKGNKYLVLDVAYMPNARVVNEGDVLGICTTCDHGLDFIGGEHLLDARYTGSKDFLKAQEEMVVYVGLYDNPKGNTVCVRPMSEWQEMVPSPNNDEWGSNVPRYVRVTA